MENNKLIGRKNEREQFDDIYATKKPALVAVYGRRRVGKTFLVRQHFNNNFDFSFTGNYQMSRQGQLSLFNQELRRFSGQDYPLVKDWFSAFEQLRQYLSSLDNERLVLFFDELPWMETPKSNFIQAFSYFWNTWASTRQGLKLFVCGSSTTWMMEKLIGDKGGLYGRVTHTIYLAPFTLGETEAYLHANGIRWNRYQMLETYMIMGGIPFYLEMLKPKLTFDQNIDNLFFAANAPLRMEYGFLFRSLFNDAQLYRQVVETIAKRSQGMTRQQIKEELGLGDGGVLTVVLENLVRCDFLRRYAAFGKSERNALYQLTDLFSLFHLSFVADNNGQDQQFWSNMRENPSRVAWRGYAFEQVCLHHIPQIKEAIGIKAVLSNVCSWSCPTFTDKDGNPWQGTQIDLLIDRRDQVINICEMKYANDVYIIDKDYEERLRRRLSTFQHLTRTRKALHLTFITTYGLSRNTHSGNVQTEVTMGDLFDR
ncbi:MAG: ATP-binding protein [Bacteroidales bacterium]|nr:ATP-binding protein [Bacteroidales bacterium]MBR6930845.1 ATP-binding protein [Bacteroidales bacterium]